MFEWFTTHLDGSVIEYFEEYIEQMIMEQFKEKEFELSVCAYLTQSCCVLLNWK